MHKQRPGLSTGPSVQISVMLHGICHACALSTEAMHTMYNVIIVAVSLYYYHDHALELAIIIIIILYTSVKLVLTVPTSHMSHFVGLLAMTSECPAPAPMSLILPPSNDFEIGHGE